MRTVALVSGLASSLLLDFAVRVAPKSTISGSTFGRLPAVTAEPFAQAITRRSLQLNCVTTAYAPLWEAVMREPWSPDVPLRIPLDRRNAMLEIDVLVAIALGVTAEELISIYRTQFPVLAGYDRGQYVYDSNGRVVPNSILTEWRRRGENDGTFLDEDLLAIHPGSGNTYLYALPYGVRDRADDIRRVYAELYSPPSLEENTW